MSSPKLARRTLLKGVASGVIVGLPLLEVMTPRTAYAAAPPKRFIVSYCGTPHGNSKVFNPAAGALPTALPAPLVNLAPVRNLVSVVGGFALPTYTAGQTPPPGGRLQAGPHGFTMAPILAGVHSVDGKPVQANGHTVDQVVADAIGGSSRLKSLQACIQAAPYGGGPRGGISSARIDNGTLRALAPEVSPKALFATLFGGAPTGGSGGASGPTSAQRKQQSVLDFILADAKTLTQKVSAADRIRLDQHFTEIRELETRLSAVPPVATASCSLPTGPSSDPALGSTGSFGGWSDETLRGDLMADMIALAIACDITRAVSLMVSYEQSFLKTQDPTCAYPDMHQTGHSGTAQNIVANASWHVGRFAKMVKSLADRPEGSGTLLDSTVVVQVFAEGSNSHNCQDMSVLIGGIPSKLKMGQSIPSSGAHPAQLMVSAMQAVGLSTTKLGEVSGAFSPILI